MSRYLLFLQIIALLVLSAVPQTPSSAQQRRGFGGGDALNFAVAKRIAEVFAEDLWPGWQRTGPATLMITPDADYFLCPPFDLPEMVDLGHHRSIGCKVSGRPKEYDPQRIEAFTLSGRVPTIVIGSSFTPDAFPLWIGIWLHEHFHQFQMGQTGYREAAEQLGLAANGEQNGQWMITFPFPYDSAEVSGSFSDMASNLLKLIRKLESGDTIDDAKLAAYRTSRESFASTVGEQAFRYAQFVAWQEGVALYSEIRLVEAVAENPTALGELARHVDARRFERLSQQLRRRMKSHLAGPALGRHERLAFYAWGAAEALLLDALDGGAWRRDYVHTRSGFRLDIAAPVIDITD